VRYDITHRTAYAYGSEVSVSHHVARLTPRTLSFQDCLENQISFEPHAAISTHHDDYYGNRTTFFSIAKPHRTLVISARSRVEVASREDLSGRSSLPWEAVRTGNVGGARNIAPEIREFVFPSPFVRRLPGLADYARDCFPAGRPLLEAVMELTGRIHQDFKFDPKATTVATPLEQVIKNRRGVCQDFAHIQIGCLRALDLPARYVSGYLETLAPPGKSKLAGSDASHAWIQAFIPPIGWVDFDPTNNLIPSERHITVAWGRDFDDVSPVRGVIVGGGKHELSVAVDVIPLGALSGHNPVSSHQQQQQQQAGRIF
jgi:transglutaminase-like putative cysteine protease